MKLANKIFKSRKEIETIQRNRIEDGIRVDFIFVVKSIKPNILKNNEEIILGVLFVNGNESG